MVVIGPFGPGETPVRVVIQVWKVGVGGEGPLKPGHIDGITPGEELLIDGAAADDEGVLRRGGPQGLHIPEDLRPLRVKVRVPGEDQVAPARQGPSPGEGGQGPAVTRTGLATRSLGGSSGGGGVGGSGDSGELFATPETSDDSYEPPSRRRSWSRAGSSGRRRL